MSAETEQGGKLRDLIFVVAAFDVVAEERLHAAIEAYLWSLPDKRLWDYYRRDRLGCWGDLGTLPMRRLEGPPCPECDEDLRWVDEVESGIYRPSGDCKVCLGPAIVAK